MIITLKLESAFGSFDRASEDWYRLIEIESNADLETLHLCIQDAVNFENDHLYEFILQTQLEALRREDLIMKIKDCGNIQ